jgi:hypothetical protein
MDWVIVLLVFIILELLLIGIRLGNLWAGSVEVGDKLIAGIVEVRDVLKEIHQELGLEDLGGQIRGIDISLSEIDHSLSEIGFKIEDIRLSMSSDD